MPSLKSALRHVLASDYALRLLPPALLGRRATVFMLHRFAHPGGEPHGHDPEVLRASLALLRRNRYTLLSLGELVARLQEGAPPPSRSVVFTVDDGYADFAEIGAPVFAEFDCPVTVFLTTGFLDGINWLWWDQLQYVLLATPRRTLTLTVDGTDLRYEWEGRADRRWVAGQIADELKRVADAVRHRLITEVASRLDVEIPTRCPPRYRPMSWDEVRSCAARGASFGPHTVTHPILSRVTDDVAEHEIAGSWSRVRAETAATTPVLCYPNGDPASFGERERRIARATGLIAAVTTEPRHVTTREFTGGGGEDPAYRLPRFGYPLTTNGLAQVVSGLEQVKGAVRGALAFPSGAAATHRVRYALPSATDGPRFTF